MSATERKKQELHRLFSESAQQGLSCIPDHFNHTYFTIISDSDRIYRVSLENLNVVSVVAIYHSYKYDRTLEDRRNAIKTAKDIFDFYHALRCSDYNNIHDSLRGKYVPPLGLYYKNEAKTDQVIVTAARSSEYSSLLANMDQFINRFDQDLDTLTELIKLDYESAGSASRWERAVNIGKDWWAH